MTKAEAYAIVEQWVKDGRPVRTHQVSMALSRLGSEEEDILMHRFVRNIMPWINWQPLNGPSEPADLHSLMEWTLKQQKEEPRCTAVPVSIDVLLEVIRRAMSADERAMKGS